MPSERVQRQIDRLLDQVEEALEQVALDLARDKAHLVLGLDADNADALAYLAAIDHAESLAPRSAEAPPAEAQAPASAPAAPTSFCDGRYEVDRFLGEGGKKRVYLAHDTKLDRDVAFALIKTDGLDEEGLLRITREAQAMGRLGDHPHVVSVYDIGDEHGQPYIVSQLMAGGDVEALIKDAPEHRVNLDTALRIADQVCQALEHAHGHGIVHRDLKPGNVWLTADPSTGSGQAIAKLGDFGLALALDRSRLTQAGMMVGTVHYMPPEQALGGAVTPKSDLYSLGGMLYELVTGRPPFVGDESVAIITQHLNTPPVAPSWHVPQLPGGLEALILRLLEKDPAKRPASASEVRQALAGIDPHPSTSPIGDAAGLSRGERRPGTSPLPLGEGGGEGVPSSQPPTENPIYRRIFVGREQELRQLQHAFDGAISGQGSLMAVVGEPGIGKTALCEQLATYVAMRNGRALVGHCYEEGSLSLPYLPFIEAMRAYVLDRDPEQLRADLGSGAEEVARIISDIRERLALSPRPTPNVGGGVGVGASPDPDEERWRLFQAVGGFLRNAAAVQPLCIVLEDLHWADRGTLDLLVHLARNLAGARLLIVATYRDIEVDRTHPLSAALAELRRASAFERVALRGLAADQVQRMLAAITGQEVPWGFAQAVQRQTEGNPLFVQEVVRYLAEEGLITRGGDRWERAGSAPLDMSIPEGLRDVIGKRLSRLSPACNRILTLAAVVGRDFDLGPLQSVAEVGEDELMDALEEAVRVGVLQEVPRRGAVGFRFAHAFFRQTLYEELFTPRRLRLHQQVARALERQYAGRLEEHAAELAEHFAQSSDPVDLAKAIEYAERAARRSFAVFAYGEAARHLERALQVLDVIDPDDRARRCDLLLALGRALGPAGEPRRAFEETAEEAFQLAEALTDGERASRACDVAIDAMHRWGTFAIFGSPTYAEWAERTDRHAAPGSRDRVLANLALELGHQRAHRWRESLRLKVEALEVARQLGDDDTLFLAARPFLRFPWPPLLWPELLALASELHSRPHAGVSTRTLGVVLGRCHMIFLAAGDRAGADAVSADLEQLAARTQDAELQTWPLEVAAIRATLDGSLEEAVSLAGALATRAEELGMALRGNALEQALSLQPRWLLGRPPGEEERLVTAEEFGSRVGRASLLEALIALVAEARAGRVVDASTYLTRVIESIDRAEWEYAPAFYVALLVDFAAQLQDVEAVTFLLPLAEGLVAVEATHAVYNAARFVGDGLAFVGDRAGAKTQFERALDWATRLRFRPEIALTRLALAEILLGGAPQERVEAQGHLDFAIEEFRAMKMQPSLERALRHKGLLRA